VLGEQVGELETRHVRPRGGRAVDVGDQFVAARPLISSFVHPHRVEIRHRVIVLVTSPEGMGRVQKSLAEIFGNHMLTQGHCD